MSSNVEPSAPPVPQWLLTGADQIAARYVMRGVSLYGVVYAAFIAGWEAGREEKSAGDCGHRKGPVAGCLGTRCVR